MAEQQQQQQDVQNRQALADNYKFSPEELRVLKECNLESFYYRSLPLGTAFGISAFYAVKGGYLKPSVKYGPLPKVMIGVFAGYILGKLSYQSTCAEKIMRIPNSRLAEALRRRKGQMTFQESMGMDPVFTSLPISPAESDKKQFAAREYRAVDLSLDAPPQSAGLNDSFRPSMDFNRPSEESSLPALSQHTTTYEELRRRNREEYDQKRSDYRKPQPPAQASEPAAPVARPVYPRYGQQDQHKHKNEYGDVWED